MLLCKLIKAESQSSVTEAKEDFTMALTRKMLKAMGIEDEKIEQIIEAHTETTDALKEERDGYKANAEKLPEMETKYNDLKKQIEDSDDDEYKEKYENEHKAFEDYKAKVNADKAKANKVDAYKSLLKEVGVSEKRIDSVIKVTSLDDIELDDEGKIKDADKVKESVKEEWSDFIVTEDRKGADTATPPDNDPNGAGAKTPSRAAQVVAKHNERLYGVKGEKE